MPSIKIVNKSIPKEDILKIKIDPTKENLSNPPITYLTNAQIANVLKKGQPFHITDSMQITVVAGEEETEKYSFVSDTIDIKSWSPSVLWKYTAKKPDSGLVRDQFMNGLAVTDFNLNFSSNKALLSIKGTEAKLIEKYKLKLAIEGIPTAMPREGLFVFQFEIGIAKTGKQIEKEVEKKVAKFLGPYQAAGVPLTDDLWKQAKKIASAVRTHDKIEKHFYIVKLSLDPPAEAAKVPPPPPERGSGTTFSVFSTKPTVVDTLFVPQLKAELVYNFYEIGEDSYDIAKEKNYFLTRLYNIPRYIRLDWNRPPITKDIIRASSNSNAVRLSNFLKNAKGSFSKPVNTLKIGNKIIKTPNLDGQSLLLSSPKTKISMNGGNDLSGISGIFSEEGSSFAFLKDLSSKKEELSSVTNRDRQYGLPEEEDFIVNGFFKSEKPDGKASSNEKSDYIGYIIVKERLRDVESDSWEVAAYIPINDIRKTNYIDTKIAYGESYRYRIRSVFKFVNIDDLTMFKDFQDSDTSVNNTSAVVFSGGQILKNVYFFDSSLSNPVEFPVLDFQRPDPPTSLQIFPDSRKKEIFITWFQKQQQNDVIGFNVYRRIGDAPFQRINNFLIEPRNNFYTDKDLQYDVEYIYAVEALDAHENTSKLSFQYEVRLKEQDFCVGNTQYPLKIAVNENLDFQDTPQTKEKSITTARSILKIVVNPLFPQKEQIFSYLIKIKSLDTFIEKELKLNFDTKLIIHNKSISDQEEMAQRIAKIKEEALSNYEAARRARREQT